VVQDAETPIHRETVTLVNLLIALAGMKKEALIETLLGLLEKGNVAELTATGYSMFPTLRPGDRALLKPLINTQLPQPGSIIVTRQKDTFVMHRLVGILDDGSDNTLFITRGDSMTEEDPPWKKEQIIGVVESLVRNDKRKQLKKKIPSLIRRKINRMMIGVWSRLGRRRN
jgi:signal peptidase I